MFAGARRTVLRGSTWPEPRPAAPSFYYCHPCGLAFANPTVNPTVRAYWEGWGRRRHTRLEAMAARSYFRGLKKMGISLGKRVGQWGCASGQFLELVQKEGAEVWGVEPSFSARSLADPSVRGKIAPRLPESETLSDTVGLFQVLERSSDPKKTLRLARTQLGPRGQVVLACHDLEAWMSRFLGPKSPLFRVENYQLFSRKGVRRLLLQNGFRSVRIRPLWNRFPLSYWLELLGWYRIARLVRTTRLDPALSLRVGNVLVTAQVAPVEDLTHPLSPTGS